MFDRCLCFLSLVHILQALSTSQIYDLVDKGIKSENASHCNELLDKYFFTENKDNAIWSSAITEIKHVLSEDLTKEEHITLEKDLQSLRQKWSKCKNIGKSDSGCLEIFDIIRSTMRDFQWSLESDLYFSKNYISIRVAYQSMALLMFSSMTNEPWADDINSAIEWYAKIQGEYNQLTKYMTDYAHKLKEEKPIEIGDAEVCEERIYMWKEFEQPGCEKRAEKNNDQNIRTSRAIKSDNDGSGDNDENDDESDDERDTPDDSNLSDEEKIFFETFADPDLNSFNLIGGKSSEYDFVLVSRFTDKNKEIVTGKKEFNVRETPKGEILEEMINETHDEREKYEKEKFKEFDSYVQSTLGKVNKISKFFASDLRKTSRLWKQKL